MRLIYTSTIRPMITYACGAWFFESRDISDDEKNPKSPISKFSISQTNIDKLERLQAACLRFITGSYARSPREPLEKEMFIDSIQIYLSRMASSYRTRVVYTPTARALADVWTNQLHPYSVLRHHALKADNDIKHLFFAQHHIHANQRWEMPRQRSKAIARYFEQKAFRESSALWDCYRANQGNRPSIQVTLMECWGPQSLQYYQGLSRAQCTMLLQCRTGFIGLNAYLYKIRVPNIASPCCPCGMDFDTVEHRFLYCNNLNAERKELERSVFNHRSIPSLLTDEAAAASSWAIRYWGIHQFEWTRKHMSDILSGTIPVSK